MHIPKAAGISVSRSLFGNLGGGHVAISTYRILLTKQEFDSYFKFSFVRNPWDRLLSAYRFLSRGGMNEYDRRWWAEHDLHHYRNFEEFVAGWISRHNVGKGMHFLPQYRYLCEPGTTTLCVDFVGSYEHMDDDYAYVWKKLNMAGTAKLMYLNKSSLADHPIDFREYYTDETRQIVEDVYREDIELFGYSFWQPSERGGQTPLIRR